MARMMDKVALIRSLHHKTGATHENGQRWMMTGHDFNADNIKPHIGSVISRVFGPRRAICRRRSSCRDKIGNTGAGPLHGQDGRLSGQRARAVLPRRRSGRRRISRSPISTPPAGQTEFRIDARRKLLDQLDELQHRTETKSTARSRHRLRPRLQPADLARDQEAFDLAEETDKLRDRYGRNTFGQSCLMARRLIEARRAATSRSITSTRCSTSPAGTCTPTAAA